MYQGRNSGEIGATGDDATDFMYDTNSILKNKKASHAPLNTNPINKYNQ